MFERGAKTIPVSPQMAQAFGIPAEPVNPAFNPDEVSVQDMKKALDDPKLGVKVIDVRDSAPP